MMSKLHHTVVSGPQQ